MMTYQFDSTESMSNKELARSYLSTLYLKVHEQNKADASLIAKGYLTRLLKKTTSNAKFLRRYGPEVLLLEHHYRDLYQAAEWLGQANVPSFSDYRSFMSCAHVFYERLILSLQTVNKTLDIDDSFLLTDYLKRKRFPNKLPNSALQHMAIICFGCCECSRFQSSKLAKKLLGCPLFQDWCRNQKSEQKQANYILSETEDFVLYRVDNLNRSLELVMCIEFDNGEVGEALNQAEIQYAQNKGVYDELFMTFLVEYLM